MAFTDRNTTGERVRGALCVTVVLALCGTAMMRTVPLAPPVRTADALTTFDVPAPSPPRPAPADTAEPEGAAAPPARRADPAPLVAPASPLPPRRPADAAPVAGTGRAPTAGASANPDLGTGGGGTGAGRGSGGAGSGTGGLVITRAVLIAGAITNRDFRRFPAALRTEGHVRLNVTVGTDGRVGACAVTQSSGNTALDAMTCRLVRERALYRPATIGGVPAAAVMPWQQRYCIGGDACTLDD